MMIAKEKFGRSAKPAARRSPKPVKNVIFEAIKKQGKSKKSTTRNMEPKTAIKKKIRVESWNSQGMFLGMVDDDCKRKKISLGQNGGAAGPETCKKCPKMR